MPSAPAPAPPPSDSDPTAAGLAKLRESVLLMDPAADWALVNRCFEFAASHHAGQLRKSGEPYVVHPLAVAQQIARMRLDVPSVCAGLLHDTIEDTNATPETVRALAGPEVQRLVDGVTKLGQIPWHSREESQAENFRKMLLAMTSDIRVMLIKLADRMDNMRTLAHMPRDKQERTSRETRDIFAPMANRLGLQVMKTEFEDLCFRYLEPDEYDKLAEGMAATAAARKEYIDSVERSLQGAMDEERISALVNGTTRHLYSIYKKTRVSSRVLTNNADLTSFRVVTDSVRNCYTALGVVHSRWMPIPGRFKDFIALPKPNLYQSLHTTIIGPRTDRVEIHLRTIDMDRTADFGIAARWHAHASKPPVGVSDGDAEASFGQEVTQDNKTFAWLHQLVEWQREMTDATEFMESVKHDLFDEEVFAFTPNGDFKSLPKGSTPIDFAFAVHSKLGLRCSGARINGLIVPLRYVLRNGDTVEILNSDKQKPTKEWLNFVVTTRAKTAIRHHLRTEQRERSRQYGRDLLTRALRDRNQVLANAEKSGRLQATATGLRMAGVEDLLVAIGYGKLTPATVAAAMYPEATEADGLDAHPGTGAGDGRNGSVTPAAPVNGEDTAAGSRPRLARRSVSGVRVPSDEDVAVRFALCCDPIPGDSIVGFFTRSRGVTVHVRDCPKAVDQDPARRVDVMWDESVTVHRPVTVEVTAADRPGVLASLTRAFTDLGINISQARCTTTDDHRAVNTFEAPVTHLEQLRALTRALFAVEGVASVKRAHPGAAA